MSATTHGDAGPQELLADRAPMDAQLGTDLAQGPTLGVQVGCTLNVHERNRNESQPHQLPPNRHAVPQIQTALDKSGRGRELVTLLIIIAGRYCGASPNFRNTCARFSADCRVRGCSSPRTRRLRAKVSSSRTRACSYSPNS
jgi:hypothetical protein